MRGFWKGVLYMGLSFIFFFLIIKWAIEGFKWAYFENIENPLVIASGFLLSGFVYGFFATFGKFWARHKRQQ